VGLGSNAAEEQQLFDSHHVPFYRIEQVLTFVLLVLSPILVKDKLFMFIINDHAL